MSAARICTTGLLSPFLHADRTARREVRGGSSGGETRRDAVAAPHYPPPPLRISSVSNPLVKHCLKLRRSSSYRRSCRSALVVGLAPIMEICRLHDIRGEMSSLAECILVMDDVEAPEAELLEFSDFLVHVSSVVMKKLSGMESADSIKAVALMSFPPTFYYLDGRREEMKSMNWLKSPHRVLVLDGIQDPGNLGTLVRSAMAFKWDGVFLLPGCCDPFNEKALRAERGASFQLPIISGEWHHLDELRTRFQMKILAAHPEKYCEEGLGRATTLISQCFTDSLQGLPLCLVLGSEGRGLSKQTMRACELVSIPMPGMFESLNVSVAGGILLFMLKPKFEIDDYFKAFSEA